MNQKSRKAQAKQDSAWKDMLDEHFEAEVVSLAVVTGHAGRTRLGRYEIGRWGCQLVFEFPLVKITDWRGFEAELSANNNPFAMVVLAQLRVLETKGDTAKQYEA